MQNKIENRKRGYVMQKLIDNLLELLWTSILRYVDTIRDQRSSIWVLQIAPHDVDCLPLLHHYLCLCLHFSTFQVGIFFRVEILYSLWWFSFLPLCSTQGSVQFQNSSIFFAVLKLDKVVKQGYSVLHLGPVRVFLYGDSGSKGKGEERFIRSISPWFS